MDNFVPSRLVKDWRERYQNKWATDFHVDMLIKLNVITEREAQFIRTGL